MEITTVHTTFLSRLFLCALLLCSINHYDITMGNKVARDEVHSIITTDNDFARDILYEVTMSNDIAMFTSQCIMTFL